MVFNSCHCIWRNCHCLKCVYKGKKLKFEWLPLQPEWFIFIAEKHVAIEHKLLHWTKQHHVQLLGAELLNKAFLFTILFILFSLHRRKAKNYLKTAVQKGYFKNSLLKAYTRFRFKLNYCSIFPHRLKFTVCYYLIMFPKDCQHLQRNFIPNYPSHSFLRISCSAIAVSPVLHIQLLKC